MSSQDICENSLENPHNICFANSTILCFNSIDVIKELSSEKNVHCILAKSLALANKDQKYNKVFYDRVIDTTFYKYYVIIEKLKKNKVVENTDDILINFIKEMKNNYVMEQADFNEFVDKFLDKISDELGLSLQTNSDLKTLPKEVRKACKTQLEKLNNMDSVVYVNVAHFFYKKFITEGKDFNNSVDFLENYSGGNKNKRAGEWDKFKSAYKNLNTLYESVNKPNFEKNTSDQQNGILDILKRIKQSYNHLFPNLEKNNTVKSMLKNGKKIYEFLCEYEVEKKKLSTDEKNLITNDYENIGNGTDNFYIFLSKNLRGDIKNIFRNIMEKIDDALDETKNDLEGCLQLSFAGRKKHDNLDNVLKLTYYKLINDMSDKHGEIVEEFRFKKSDADANIGATEEDITNCRDMIVNYVCGNGYGSGEKTNIKVNQFFKKNINDQLNKCKKVFEEKYMLLFRNRTIITLLFGFLEQAVKKCVFCDYNDVTLYANKHIDLILSEDKNEYKINELLNNYEKFKPSYDTPCPTCKKHTLREANKILLLPPVAIIEINRNNSGKKNNAKLLIDSEQLTIKDTTYDIVSMCYHKGGDTNNGHYVSIVKCNGGWRQHNNNPTDTKKDNTTVAKDNAEVTKIDNLLTNEEIQKNVVAIFLQKSSPIASAQ